VGDGRHRTAGQPRLALPCRRLALLELGSRGGVETFTASRRQLGVHHLADQRVAEEIPGSQGVRHEEAGLDQLFQRSGEVPPADRRDGREQVLVNDVPDRSGGIEELASRRFQA
jgi:hypothetical protein